MKLVYTLNYVRSQGCLAGFLQFSLAIVRKAVMKYKRVIEVVWQLGQRKESCT